MSLFISGSPAPQPPSFKGGLLAETRSDSDLNLPRPLAGNTAAPLCRQKLGLQHLNVLSNNHSPQTPVKYSITATPPNLANIGNVFRSISDETENTIPLRPLEQEDVRRDIMEQQRGFADGVADQMLANLEKSFFLVNNGIPLQDIAELVFDFPNQVFNLNMQELLDFFNIMSNLREEVELKNRIFILESGGMLLNELMGMNEEAWIILIQNAHSIAILRRNNILPRQIIDLGLSARLAKKFLDCSHAVVQLLKLEIPLVTFDTLAGLDISTLENITLDLDDFIENLQAAYHSWKDAAQDSSLPFGTRQDMAKWEDAWTQLLNSD